MPYELVERDAFGLASIQDAGKQWSLESRSALYLNAQNTDHLKCTFT